MAVSLCVRRRRRGRPGQGGPGAGRPRRAGRRRRRLRCRWRRPRTTIPAPQAATRPDLVLHGFRPNPVTVDTHRCGDITYIAAEEGWLYLATVIDIASRRVVGWATADHLQAVCRTRRPTDPVLFHSDRGCQYAISQLAALAAEFGVRLSVGRAAARTAIFEWIESWYNLQRLHSSLGYRTSADYEAVLAA